MRNKTVVLIVLALVALLVSACAPTQEAATNPRILSVNGNASVTAAPDIAYVSVGVHSENENAAQAVADNNVQAQAIVDALKGMGLEEKDIRTLGFNIYPQDQYSPEGQKTGTRFIVENTVYVTLRDISKIGDILGAAVDAGANTVYGIQFDIADKTALIVEARKQAITNAQTQAQELAEAAGVTLGEVQSLNYYNSIPTPIMDNKYAGGVGGGAAELAAAVPVSPGQLTITADVSISYVIR
jgi:hypothetical protein